MECPFNPGFQKKGERQDKHAFHNVLMPPPATHTTLQPPRPSYLEDGAVQIVDQAGLVVVGGGGRTPSRAIRRSRQPLLGL